MRNKGVIVLSFDDGRRDLYTNICPILQKFGFPATFNITTGYVDGSLELDNRFCNNEPLQFEELTELTSNDKFEIAAHGDQHLNNKKDIEQSIIKLKKWGLVNNQIGFASPCHGLDKLSDEELMKFKDELNLAYIRIGTKLERTFIASVKRRLVNVLGLRKCFVNIYSNCLNAHNLDTKLYRCVPYNNRMSVDSLKDMVMYASEKSEILILLFHSVLKKDEEFHDNIENIDYNIFYEFCEFLYDQKKNNNIEIKNNIQLSNESCVL